LACATASRSARISSGAQPSLTASTQPQRCSVRLPRVALFNRRPQTMKHTLTLLAGLLLGQLAALHAQEYSTRLAADERQSRPSVERLFHESLVWAANEAGLKAHHVFGLCRSKKGTVLAFCEGRIEPDDLDPHHVLLKRSTDRGATWGKDIFVERSDGQESFANPTPVVDRHTGRIFLFYALNIDNQRSQVFYRTSDDDGVTWSDRTEVSRLFDGDQLKRPFHLPGPGHAVQLHSGRLVVPIWHRLAISRDYKSPPWEKRLYATSVITSDDGGETWRAGEFTPTEFHCNESRVVELSDGQLLLNSRSVGFLEEGEKRRVEARSRDAGATWSSIAWSETFPSFTPCDTGFIRLDHGAAKDKDWLVYSWPDHSTKRVNMTVALSTDGGRTWATRRHVAMLSGYSDLVELDDGSIGLLYDSGGKAVHFARFGLDWLHGGQPQPGK